MMTIHQAVLLLDLQYRLEAIDFLSDCCNDLRVKTLTYQDMGGDHVLNLTVSHKEYIPFTSHLENDNHTDDRFDDFRMQPFCDPHNFHHQYDYGGMEYGNPPEILGCHFETSAQDIWETSEEKPSEPLNPVNLVMPGKRENNLPPSQLKKSRRKQMFTRKSVRLLSSKSSEGREPKDLTKRDRRRRKTTEHEKAKAEEVESEPMCCRLCRIQYVNLREFKRHKEDGKCKPLHCTDCGMTFKFVTHLQKHQAGHQLYDCRYCCQKLSSKSRNREHMKQAHPEVKHENDQLIPCKFCPKSFPRLNRLYSHYQICHSKGKFVCITCGIFLQTNEKHKEHMMLHENEKKWACDQCSRKFFSKHLLTNHIKTHNSGIYRCLTCQLSVASKQELLSHKKDGHEIVGLEPQFKCDDCQKMFMKKSTLAKHMLIHRNNREFRCSHCSKAFNTSYGLTKHQRRNSHLQMASVVPPESKFERIFQDQKLCECCGKQFKTHTQFSAHVRIHKTSYDCHKCNKTLNVKDNMRRHLKKHETDAAKYTAICHLCGDKFSRVGGLQEHIALKHSDERPVACPSCPKRFKRKSELNRHRRIHDSVRPYVCFCGKAYRQTSHLKSHQVAVHKVHEPNPHSSLLSLSNFEDHDYRIQQVGFFFVQS